LAFGKIGIVCKVIEIIKPFENNTLAVIICGITIIMYVSIMYPSVLVAVGGQAYSGFTSGGYLSTVEASTV
jgi:hypothetical protein